MPNLQQSLGSSVLSYWEPVNPVRLLLRLLVSENKYLSFFHSLHDTLPALLITGVLIPVIWVLTYTDYLNINDFINNQVALLPYRLTTPLTRSRVE